MHNPLRDALVIEVRDLLAKDEVLEQRRPAEARLQRVLVVRDGDALVGREHALCRIDTHAIERTDGGILADVRTAAAGFVDPFSSVTVLAPTIGSAGLTDAPLGGSSAASGSYSAALFGLKGNADATSCVPAAFSATTSPAPDASGSAGPLTVVRLFRTVLLRSEVLAALADLARFAVRDVLAMYGVTAAAKMAASLCGSSLPGRQHIAYQLEDARHHTCFRKT
jgi:hypothetical protein